jgi:WD40 repeat protein
VQGNLLTRAAFSTDAAHVAWVLRGGSILSSPMPVTGRRPLVLRQRGAEIEALTIDDTGRYLYVSEQQKLGLYCYDTLNPSKPPKHYQLPAAVRRMTSASGGVSVFVSLDDGTVRHIDFSAGTASERSRVKLPGAAGQLARVPSGDMLVVAGAGASAGMDVGVIDGLDSHRLSNRHLGGAASDAALSRSAELIAVTDYDGRLHLWDIDSRVPMASLKIADDALDALAISPDGRQLAVSSLAGGIYELTLDRDRWRSYACNVVRRDLTAEEWTALVPGEKPEPGCAPTR